MIRFTEPQWKKYLSLLAIPYHQLRRGDREDIRALQAGECAICGEYPDVLAIDHDHKTGQVRGALCSKCNWLLGNARDSVAILRSAVQYLELGKSRLDPTVPIAVRRDRRRYDDSLRGAHDARRWSACLDEDAVRCE